mmetsp:Transcript_37575/g.107349  ORF Transcript_37575/g.107349 Transcript_37575/m.107349 type:complete len:261 (-) Transcript_37575:384-1166(-)
MYHVVRTAIKHIILASILDCRPPVARDVDEFHKAQSRQAQDVKVLPEDVLDECARVGAEAHAVEGPAALWLGARHHEPAGVAVRLQQRVQLLLQPLVVQRVLAPARLLVHTAPDCVPAVHEGRLRQVLAAQCEGLARPERVALAPLQSLVDVAVQVGHALLERHRGHGFRQPELVVLNYPLVRVPEHAEGLPAEGHHRLGEQRGRHVVQAARVAVAEHHGLASRRPGADTQGRRVHEAQVLADRELLHDIAAIERDVDEG